MAIMKSGLLLVLFVGLLCVHGVHQTAPDRDEHQKSLSRSKRFFGFFSRVNFANDECKSNMSDVNGTCYTLQECMQRGGKASGGCAQNFGVCCVFVFSCHNRTAESMVTFTNPSTPNKDTAAEYCELTIEVPSPQVCQIRVDFDVFEIDGPTDGECKRDNFQILGAGTQNLGIGALCGNNAGQHLYIDVTQSTRPQTMTLVFITDAQDDYHWKMRITQVNCKDDKKALQAPMSCLQFYTGISQTFSSFNFGHYTKAQDYSICIQRQPSSCSVRYKAAGADWNIDTSAGDKAKSGVGTTECSNDYVMLTGGSSTGDDPTQDRYCGGVLNPVSGQDADVDVISKVKGPIVVRFRTDKTHETSNQDGFRITYEQLSTGC